MNLSRNFLNKLFVFSSLMGVMLTSVLLTACSDDEEETSGSEIIFNDYAPTVGGQGTMLTLTGENFGAKITEVSVWINDKEVDVMNVTQTQINGRVPAGAGSGVVKVAIGDREHTYPTPFEYLVDYVVSTFAGNGEAGYVDSTLAEARFEGLVWLTYDSKNDVIYTLESNVSPQRIRRIKDGVIETVLNFREQSVYMNNPRTIEFSITGDTIFVSNDNDNKSDINPHAVGILTRDDDFKVLKPLIASPTSVTGGPHINFAGVHPIDGTLLYYSWEGRIYTWDVKTGTPTLLADVLPILRNGDANRWGSYAGLRFSPDGETLYLIARDPYHGILSAGYDIKTKTISREFSRFVGAGSEGANDGVGTEARVKKAVQGVFGSDGNLYIVEQENHVVRRITPEAEVITFIGTLGAGSGYVNGDASEAKFYEPNGITFDKHGNMYVAEFRNHRIRLIKKAE